MACCAAAALYSGKSDGPQALKIEGLQPNRRYTMGGATPDTIVADSAGTARITVQLSGRSPCPPAAPNQFD